MPSLEGYVFNRGSGTAYIATVEAIAIAGTHPVSSTADPHHAMTKHSCESRVICLFPHAMNTDVSGSNATESKEGEYGSVASTADAGGLDSREKWRANLRDVNVRVWLQGPVPVSVSLDSSLRRNSTFIKRLRQPNIAESKEVLLQELEYLNLRKYLDELVPSLLEMLSRNAGVKDRYAAVEILSALHAKFGGEEFTMRWIDTMAQVFVPSMPAPDASAEQLQKEEANRVVRYRNLIRVVMELVLVGYIGPVSEKDVLGHGLEWLFGILRGLVCVRD